jgi:hypothetical protein
MRGICSRLANPRTLVGIAPCGTDVVKKPATCKQITTCEGAKFEKTYSRICEECEYANLRIDKNEPEWLQDFLYSYALKCCDF